MIGYKADEIIGKHFGILYRPDERRAGEPNRALELAIQNGKHEVEGWRIRKNGAPFFVTGALTAIRDDHGNLIGFANVIRDATERRDTQEKLVEAREQLAMAQKMEAIGKLTGGIAHDFNNLLMIIGGNAQTFKRLLDPKLPRAIEAIQTAAKRGESLTRQLLTFSRRQHSQPDRGRSRAPASGTCARMIESSLRGNIVYKEQIEAGIDRRQGRPCRARTRHRQYRGQCARRHAERRRVFADGRATSKPTAASARIRARISSRWSSAIPAWGFRLHLLTQDLRSVLHHQGGRQRHRPRPVAGLWLCPPGGRHGAGRQHRRPGHHHHHLSAGLHRGRNGRERRCR